MTEQEDVLASPNAALEDLADRELLRHARRVGRRRVRDRLAVNEIVRDALRELDGAAAENPPPRRRSSSA